MAPVVVVTLHLPAAQQARLEESCQLVLPRSAWPIPRCDGGICGAHIPDGPKSHNSREELLALVPGVQGILCTSSDSIDPEVLDLAGPGLTTVSTMSAGFDHIDVAAVRGRGVRLGHTPGVLTDSVAEVTVGLAVAVMRGLGRDEVRSGAWAAAPTSSLFSGLGDSLQGATCGFLGLGRIGLGTARRLWPFGVRRILYCGRTESAEAAEVGAERVTMDQLAEQSDVIFVCASLNPSTVNIVNAAFLAKMRPSAYLVNTARGGLVDQEALVAALTAGRLRGAALDVMTPEPLPAGHPLAQCPGVLLTPHLGSATGHARTAMADLAVSNLLAGVAGEALPSPIQD